jgi:hypothetical protein
MAARVASRKRTLGLAFAGWLSLVIGLYAVVATASVIGLFTGVLAGAIGGLMALAVVSDRPKGRTRRVAKVALTINAAAVAVVAVLLLGFWIAER